MQEKLEEETLVVGYVMFACVVQAELQAPLVILFLWPIDTPFTCCLGHMFRLVGNTMLIDLVCSSLRFERTRCQLIKIGHRIHLISSVVAFMYVSTWLLLLQYEV